MVTALVLGIDPGAHGCASLLTVDGKVFECLLFDKHTPRELCDAFSEFRADIVSSMVEKVHSMPRQGVASTFKFGYQFGQIVGILTGLKIPFEFVTPQRWQKEMGCQTKGDKNVSKQKAEQLFPNQKITHGNADSLIIAEYARRRWNKHSPVF